MTDEPLDYFEQAHREAHREVTDELYHYTSAEAAIFEILRTGQLRLSPFESTNDLWESRPLHPSLSSHSDDEHALTTTGGDRSFDLWSEIDRNIRLHAKVACFTEDIRLTGDILDPDVRRGFAHLSLWAHYGRAHSGVCLRFDKARLLAAFEAAPWPGAAKMHRQVKYWEIARAPIEAIDIGQVREFGADAAALRYARLNSDTIFFSKHVDWSNETEYRLAVLDQSVLPLYLDVRDALTGVYLGHALQQTKLAALSAVLQDPPNLEVVRLSYFARRLQAWPLSRDDLAVKPKWDEPLRSGSAIERSRLLDIAEETAAKLKERGDERLQSIQQALLQLVFEAVDGSEGWGDVHIQRIGGLSAIPPSKRARRAGVPGEVVEAQHGHAALLTPTNGSWPSLVVAAAAQALPGERMRICVNVVLEKQLENGTVQRDLSLEEASEKSDSTAVETLLELQSALRNVMPNALRSFRTALAIRSSS